MTITQNYPQFKKLPHWITIGLVILLGISLANLFWLIMSSDEDEIAESITSESNNITDKTMPQQNYGKLIANEHLFGVVKKQPKVKNTEAKDEPKAVVSAPKLNIKVFGIVAYNNKTSGYALLSYNGGGQQVYSVGDELADKVTVIDLQTEKVIIDNHGKHEEFLLPKFMSGNGSNGNSRLLAANSSSNLRPVINALKSRQNLLRTAPKNPTAPSLNPAVSKSVVEGKENALSIDSIAKFRDEVMADPAKIMEVASAQPYSKAGQFMGFKVSPGKQRRFFRQLGLRNGDVVKEVNGILLDSPQKGVMLMSELSGATDLNITVLRGEREIQLPTLSF